MHKHTCLSDPLEYSRLVLNQSILTFFFPYNMTTMLLDMPTMQFLLHSEIFHPFFLFIAFFLFSSDILHIWIVVGFQSILLIYVLYVPMLKYRFLVLTQFQKLVIYIFIEECFISFYCNSVESLYK